MDALNLSDLTSQKNGHLIVLEGIDGAGKSTLTPLVCDRLRPPRGQAIPLDKKQVTYPDAYSRTHLTRLRQVIWDERKPKFDVMGGHHWALLIAGWYAVIGKRTLTVSEHTFVSDGWYFRNIVKALEEHAELNEVWLRALFEPVRAPDVVVLLDVPPELAQRRGRAFDARERGMRALGGPTDFNTFQSRIRSGLLRMATRENWIVIRVREEHTPEQLADQVSSRIHQLLGWRTEEVR